MRILTSILILCILWSGNALSDLSQKNFQTFVDKNLKNKKLDPLEGIWIGEKGSVLGIHKVDSKFIETVISFHDNGFLPKKIIGEYEKYSNILYAGKSQVVIVNSENKILYKPTCDAKITIENKKSYVWYCAGKINELYQFTKSVKFTRVYPDSSGTSFFFNK